MKMMLLSYFGLHGVTSSLPILVLGCDCYMYNMMINSGYMVGFFWGQVWKMNDYKKRIGTSLLMLMNIQPLE